MDICILWTNRQWTRGMQCLLRIQFMAKDEEIHFCCEICVGVEVESCTNPQMGPNTTNQKQTSNTLIAVQLRREES